MGARARATGAVGPPGPRDPGRRQRLVPRHRRRCRGALRAGRLRRAVRRAATATGRPRRTCAVRPETARAGLPRRVADHTAPRRGRAAQRRVRHGLPETGPSRRDRGHPARARGVRGGGCACLHRWLLRNRPRKSGQPGPGVSVESGRDGARRAISATPPATCRSTPAVTLRLWTAGSRCRTNPGSERPPTQGFSSASKRGVAGSRPRTLDAPCIASCSNGGSETPTPGW